MSVFPKRPGASGAAALDMTPLAAAVSGVTTGQFTAGGTIAKNDVVRLLNTGTITAHLPACAALFAEKATATDIQVTANMSANYYYTNAMAVLQNGNIAVAYSAVTSSYPTVVVYTPSGSPLTTTTHSAYTTSNGVQYTESDLDILVLQDKFIVAQAYNSTHVHLRAYDNTGVALSDTVSVPASGGGYNVGMCLLKNGNIGIVYGSTSSLKVAEYDSKLVVQVAAREFINGAADIYGLCVIPLADGGFACGYMHYLSSVYTLKITIFNADGTTRGTYTSGAFSGDTSAPAGRVGLAQLSGGNIVGCASLRSSSWYYTQYAVISSVDASTVKALSHVSSPYSSWSYSPKLTALPTGGFAVTTNVYYSGNGIYAAYLHVFDSAGSALLQDIKIGDISSVSPALTYRTGFIGLYDADTLYVSLMTASGRVMVYFYDFSGNKKGSVLDMVTNSYAMYSRFALHPDGNFWMLGTNTVSPYPLYLRPSKHDKWSVIGVAKNSALVGETVTVQLSGVVNGLTQSYVPPISGDTRTKQIPGNNLVLAANTAIMKGLI